MQPEERLMITTVFESFFHNIATKNEDGLMSTVSAILTSFLGKTNATRADVITFLNKIYKDNVSKMSWTLLNDFVIDKKEIGDEKYEYSVGFSADQNVDYIDEPAAKQHFKIKAKVDPKGNISEFNMTRIIE